MIKKIIKSVLGERISFSLYNFLQFLKMRFFNAELYNNVKNNKKFCGIHTGKRCFILGNGPSLKNVDLEILKDEYVFTVNCFSRVKGFEKVNSNYHLWIDSSFFELRDDQKYNHDDLIEDYYKISKTNAVCFVPSIAFNFIKKNNLDKILDFHYLLLGQDSVNNPKIEYDLSKFITGYTNVVQYAISIAIYMGFSEIYLLGCDSTGVMSLLNTAMNLSNSDVHAYDKDDVDERNKQILSKWTMTDVFYDQYLLFHGYRVLEQITVKKGIKLINCSDSTLINEIPRKKISEIL